MMLAARLVAHVTLTARLDHTADFYGSLVPVRPALQEGGARVDPHAAELLRFFAHCASEPARHVTEADGSMRTTAAQVGGSRTADMTGRSDFYCRGSCMDLQRVNRYGTSMAIAAGTIAAGSASIPHSGTASTRLVGSRCRSTRNTRTASMITVAES